MSEKKKGELSAEFFAELEGDYAPLAGAPRLFKRQSAAAGYQDLAGDAVRTAVLQALLETGYGRALAEKMAEEFAAKLPSIQQAAEEQVAA